MSELLLKSERLDTASGGRIDDRPGNWSNEMYGILSMPIRVPVSAEVTGVTEAIDGTAMFVKISRKDQGCANAMERWVL